MKIVLSADHAGFELKNKVFGWLKDAGYDVEDLGNHVYDSQDDYPDFASRTAQTISAGKADKGLIICGSGVGATIAANKFRGVRACLCHDTYSAGQGVEHDDMNVLCLGARIVGEALAHDLVFAFVKASFRTEERFIRRLEKVLEFEK